ncbi:MAG: YqzL family protein [Epulopiscium sp.]|nr:YqzL family protein [Candidatus Epulonipiscium sp.]
MLDQFYWKVFEQTGNIQAYLGMVEYEDTQNNLQESLEQQNEIQLSLDLPSEERDER